MTHNTVAVLGGGITGLTVAYDLSRKGFEVAVLEKNEVPGGMIETEDINGVIVERGLQMGLENTAELIRLLGELGLQEEITYANTCGDVKYILK
ncbi:partial Protoporphyrinogen oxidase, partial [uncultured bacterium]